jgi:hypothetical protein
MPDGLRSREATYFWGVAYRARMLRAAGRFHGPEAESLLDDLSAIAVCTNWPALQRRVEEAGRTFSEWLEAA